MNGDDQTTRALAREVGRNSVERLGDGLRRLPGEVSALFRLLLSAIFLLNVAGFWFRFSFAETIAAEHRDEVAVLFGTGAAVSLLALLVSLVLTIPLARSMRRAITHWTQVSVTGDLSDEAMADARRVKLMGTAWLGATSLVGFAALVLFVTGLQVASNDFAVFTRALEPAPADSLPPAADNAGEIPGDTLNAVGNAAAPTPVGTISPPPAPSATPTTASSPRPARAGPNPRPAPTPARPAAPPPSIRSPSPSPVTPAPSPAAPAPQPEPAATP
jgi:hypothetical protein